MPPPRPEPTPARGNEEKHPRVPQAAESDAVPAAKPSGAWKTWLPLGVTLVVLPLVAYGMTTYVLVPHLQKSLVAAGVVPAMASSAAPVKAASHGAAAAAPAGGEITAAGGQRQTAVLSKLLVNVAGTMASRYLLTSMTLISDAPDFAKRVEQNEPKLRDMATGLMMMKTIANLEKPGARNLLRGELIAGFNTILGNAAIQELYFTEFAIQ